jgi:predicted site-specific integrase-resolvase
LSASKGLVIIMAMKIGYARVSTDEQNLDLQLDRAQGGWL